MDQAGRTNAAGPDRGRAFAGWRTDDARALLAALVAAGACAHAQVPEGELKSAFVYNFLALTTWPDESGPLLRLCVAGNGQPGKSLRTLAGKALRERSISVITLGSTERVPQCHALFVPRTEIPQAPAWMAAFAGQPTLTIAEGSPGAMLNLRLAGDQIVFDVDTRLAGAARITLSHGEGVEIVDVGDDGPGVPAEQRESVFEPFVRLSEGAGGAGLGLPAARSIARAHGGDIVILDAEKGALLRVTLPA